MTIEDPAAPTGVGRVVEPPGPMLSVQEVAQRTALSPRTIYRAVERGELRASRLAGLRITPDALDEWIAANALPSAAPAVTRPTPSATRSSAPRQLRAVLGDEVA